MVDRSWMEAPGERLARCPAGLIWALSLSLAGTAMALTPDEIDAHFEELAAKQHTAVTELVDEAAFARRIFLDLLGTIPSQAELDRFLAGGANGRRERLIDELLQDRRLSSRWARVIRQQLIGRLPKKGDAMAIVLESWLEDRLSRGIGLDRITRAILTAEGTPMDNPATVVLLQFDGKREDTAGHVADVFLGAQIQCARCHDHPFASWTQNDFFGFDAFFARTRKVEVPAEAYEAIRAGRVQTVEDLAELLPDRQRKAIRPGGPMEVEAGQALLRLRRLRESTRRDPLAYQGPDTVMEAAERSGMGAMGEGSAGRVRQLPLLVEVLRGETRMIAEDGTETGPALAARFIDGDEVPDGKQHRRFALAERMTAADDPRLARALVNRIWFRMTGRGLVEAVNNVTKPDDATHASLLDRLARDFASASHDLRHILRLIARTKTYQRRAGPASGRIFASAIACPLEPEQVFASIVTATGIDEVVARKKKVDFDSLRRSFERQFVHSFAVDETGERVSYEGTIQQALFILNSQAFNATVSAEEGSALHQLADLADAKARLTSLTRRVLSREPSEDELVKLTDHLKTRSAGAPGETKQRLLALRQAYEDILWAMISSAEFLTNH